MALNSYWNVWTIWGILVNKVGLVKFPSMILFCKNAKNAAKNDLLNPSQAYQWNSPKTTNTDFQYKASQNQEQYRDCTECSAIPWGTQNGCTLHAHSKKPISAREGSPTITIGQWILTAPVILLLSSDIYSATTFNFFPFYIQCIIHSQQDAVQLYLCS